MCSLREREASHLFGAEREERLNLSSRSIRVSSTSAKVGVSLGLCRRRRLRYLVDRLPRLPWRDRRSLSPGRM